MKKIFSFIFCFVFGFIVISNITSAQTKITNKTILCQNGKKIKVLNNDKKFVAALENVCHEIFKKDFEWEKTDDDTTHVFFVNFKTHNFLRYDRDTKNIYQFNWRTDFVFVEKYVTESIEDPEMIVNLKKPSERSIEYYKDTDSFWIRFYDGPIELVQRVINASMYTIPIEGSHLDVNKAPITAYNIYVDLKIKKNEHYNNKFFIYKYE